MLKQDCSSRHAPGGALALCRGSTAWQQGIVLLVTTQNSTAAADATEEAE